MVKVRGHGFLNVNLIWINGNLIEFVKSWVYHKFGGVDTISSPLIVVDAVGSSQQ